MQDIWDSILSATYHQVQWLDHWYDILYIMKGLYNFGRIYMKKSHIIAWSLNTKCVITHVLDLTAVVWWLQIECSYWWKFLDTMTIIKTNLYKKLFSLIIVKQRICALNPMHSTNQNIYVSATVVSSVRFGESLLILCKNAKFDIASHFRKLNCDNTEIT